MHPSKTKASLILFSLAIIIPLVNSFAPFNLSHLRITQQTMATSTSQYDDPLIHRYDSPFLPEPNNEQQTPSSLIILNTPIVKSNAPCLSGALNVLWQKSSYRICADGGANRLYEATVGSVNGTIPDTKYVPDLITGDLDSLFPHVREYYEKRGVPVVKIEDQDYHDLDKALMAVEKWIDNTDTTKTTRTKCYIYGGFGGRFDQEMACINALHVWGQKQKFQHTSISLYGEETCAFLLPAGPVINEIRIPFPDGRYTGKTNGHGIIGEGPSCGLIPIGGRCDEVITTGLKWNLNGDVPLEFGGLVSSSNRVLDEVVTVVTSSPMIFTTEMMRESVGRG